MSESYLKPLKYLLCTEILQPILRHQSKHLRESSRTPVSLIVITRTTWALNNLTPSTSAFNHQWREDHLLVGDLDTLETLPATKSVHRSWVSLENTMVVLTPRSALHKSLSNFLQSSLRHKSTIPRNLLPWKSQNFSCKKNLNLLVSPKFWTLLLVA